MPVFQGYPPWPPSNQEDWPAWTGFSTGNLFLGPPAPVPMNAGGPGITIIPAWDKDEQEAEQNPPLVTTQTYAVILVSDFTFTGVFNEDIMPITTAGRFFVATFDGPEQIPSFGTPEFTTTLADATTAGTSVLTELRSLSGINWQIQAVNSIIPYESIGAQGITPGTTPVGAPVVLMWVTPGG